MARELVEAIRETALPWHGSEEDDERFLAKVGDARFVLMGEASHGTRDFYEERARLSRLLIEQRGFRAVAIEGDWPDAYRVDRFVRIISNDSKPEVALAGFDRFPQWMWRNTDVVAFVDWLRAHNLVRPRGERCGFYGLDLYSLFRSIDVVTSYLERTDPAMAERARARYACFDHHDRDSQRYGRATYFSVTASCQEEVLRQFEELHQHAVELARTEGRTPEAAFAALRNARLVQNAEQYYRTMFLSNTDSWNIRDQHMADTLESIAEHLEEVHGEPAKIVVWAHNSHVGDARATQMGEGGEVNLGQLVRERHPKETFILGFTTSWGTVSAASDWDEPVERRIVRPPLPGSYEALFQATGIPQFLLDLRDLGESAAALREPRLERAIGVVYRPATERQSHYFRCAMPSQFDAVMHIDRTLALTPLERSPTWERGEAPETYPSGM